MTPLSQRNSQWASLKLGDGETTIGGYGCLITCLAMVAGITPDVINDKLKEVEGFSGDLVIWAKVKEAIGWDFTYPISYDNDKVREQIDKNGFCLIKVDWDSKISTPADMHFVLYIGNQQMIDPWTGVTKSTSYYPLVTGYCQAEKVAPTEVLTQDQKTALALLTADQTSFKQGNLESTVRFFRGKVGELDNANDSIKTLKTELSDRENYIQGQKATINDLQESQADIAEKLGVTNDISFIKGEITKLIMVEDELDDTRRKLEVREKEIVELKKNGAIAKFHLLGYLFKVYEKKNN